MESFVIMAIAGGIMYFIASAKEKAQKQKLADKKLFESAFEIEPKNATDLKIKIAPHKPPENQKSSNGGILYFFLFLLWISSGLSFLYALYSILANIIHFNILAAVGWSVAAFVIFIVFVISQENMDKMK